MNVCVGPPAGICIPSPRCVHALSVVFFCSLTDWHRYSFVFTAPLPRRIGRRYGHCQSGHHRQVACDQRGFGTGGASAVRSRPFEHLAAFAPDCLFDTPANTHTHTHTHTHGCRYLAGKTGCQVLACELQEELHHSAKELTDRCGLDEKVLHLSGNFLSVSQVNQPF
jgi:hypothetical protein